MAFIRKYQPSDFEAMAHICRATLPPSLAPYEPARRLAPYLWTHPYTTLSPATCFVLDDGAGAAVGYCIGCPSVPRLCASYARYVADVLAPSPEVPRPADATGGKQPWRGPDGGVNEACLAQMAHDPGRLLAEDNADVLAAGFAATMHVDLLEAWQRRGWGRALVREFVGSVRGEEGGGGGGRGVWLGVAADNTRVVPFYEKMGFAVWAREGAAEGGSVCMVREFGDE